MDSYKYVCLSGVQERAHTAQSTLDTCLELHCARASLIAIQPSVSNSAQRPENARPQCWPLETLATCTKSLRALARPGSPIQSLIAVTMVRVLNLRYVASLRHMRMRMKTYTCWYLACLIGNNFWLWGANLAASLC